MKQPKRQIIFYNYKVILLKLNFNKYKENFKN